jgi:diacylglycerol kinase family enzyme
MIEDRPFVNNASFGAYAEIVQSPEYRDNKNRTMLAMLPDLLTGPAGANLTVRAGDHTDSNLQAVLVSNNPYGSGRVRDMGRRARLDQGSLGILAGRLSSATQAVGLLRRRKYRPISTISSKDEVIIDAPSPTIPVGIDGEAVTVNTPVHCTIRPRALRVLLPRNRPGVPPPRPRIDWTRLWHLAFGH